MSTPAPSTRRSSEGEVAGLITADLGNSAAKLVAWAADRQLSVRSLAWEELEREAPAWFAGHRAAGTLLLASVAGSERLEAIRSLAQGAGLTCLEPDSGLTVECRRPELVGRDRLFAARAALERCEVERCSAAVVVDAGTALTVDVATRAGPGDLRFLGGAIAPGPRLLAEALGRGTRALPTVELLPGPPALGRSTDEAIQAGVVHGLRGAASELVERVAAEAGLPSETPVVLTGGALVFLIDPEPFTRRRLIVAEHLVHEGLRASVTRPEGAGR